MKVYNYTVIFEPVEEGGYDVIVPADPGDMHLWGHNRGSKRNGRGCDRLLS